MSMAAVAVVAAIVITTHPALATNQTKAMGEDTIKITTIDSDA